MTTTTTPQPTSSTGRTSRSRWAAIGAAVAVTIGAGGVFTSWATSGSSKPSSFVAITPVRVLDTRSNLGLSGVFTSPTGRDLLVTGSIATADGVQTVVPAGATAVVLNVTVVAPTANGFLSVRPADAAGAPSTSNLNFGAGQVIPNAVIVQVPTSGGDAGKIEITYSAFGVAGPTTHVLVDIVGYYQVPAAPARVIWVATSGGDFTKLSDALAAIGTTLPASSASVPYVIKIAPGVYTESGMVTLKSFVDIEGSGQDVTTITCVCAGSLTFFAEGVSVEIRHLTVSITGGGIAIYTLGAGVGLSLLHVTAAASGTNGFVSNIGVRNDGGVGPTMTFVTATATGSDNYNTGVANFGSSPIMNNVVSNVSGANVSGVLNSSSSPIMNNLTVTVSGAASIGVYNVDDGSSPTIRNSSITATGNSIWNNNGTSAKVANTMLTLAVFGTGFTCAFVVNASFVALNTSCA